MTYTAQAKKDIAQAKRDENLLFFKRLLKNPRALGAVTPSSLALANFICRHVESTPESYVVEIGAGTGRFTRALLRFGVAPAQLYVVEMDPELCKFLTQHFPQVTVINGDARSLLDILPSHIIGKVSTVISWYSSREFIANRSNRYCGCLFCCPSGRGTDVAVYLWTDFAIIQSQVRLAQKTLGQCVLEFSPCCHLGL